MDETLCLKCGKPAMTAFCTNRCEREYMRAEKIKQDARESDGYDEMMEEGDDERD